MHDLAQFILSCKCECWVTQNVCCSARSHKSLKCHKYWFGDYKSILAGKETNALRSVNQSWLCICQVSQKEESRIRRVTKKGSWTSWCQWAKMWMSGVPCRELHCRQNWQSHPCCSTFGWPSQLSQLGIKEGSEDCNEKDK